VPSTADIHASVIERAHDVGLAIWGSDANIEATVVRETKILEGAPSAGFGIGVQMDDDTGNPSTATLRFSVVDKCLRLGIMASGADMTIADTLVRDTAPGADGFLGDGIVVHSIVGPAQLRAERVRIERSERAAFGNFGAEATLVGSELLCQDFDIVAEPFMDIEPKMHDGGGNRCGCPTAADSCKSESSGIEPPTALGH